MLQRAIRFLLPPVSIRRTPTQLVVETPSLYRLSLLLLLAGASFILIPLLSARNTAAITAILGKPGFALGLLGGALITLLIVELVAQRERITIDGLKRRLVRQRRLLWLWVHRRELKSSAISEVFIDSAEIVDGSHRKAGHLVFHPMLRLANGTVERVSTRWSFKRDEARAITAAISELLATPARTDPVVHATAEELAQNKAALARAEKRSGIFGARLIGGVFLLGALSTGLMALREAHFRQDAEIVGAVPQCAFTWRLHSDQREIKYAPCDSKPTPDRARPESKPQVRQGLLLDVRFANDHAQEQRHRVFVGSPEAERVRDRGRVAVFWDPANPEAIRPSDSRPLAMPLVLLAIGLLILLLPELRRLGAGRERA